MKLHTLLDLRGNIPAFISITEGRVHDVNVLDELIPQAGAIYVMDRGYLDFARLYTFYVLVAIVRKRLMLTHVSLYTILQVLSVTLFEKLPIYQLVTSPGYTYNIRENAMQLKLFDY